MCGRVDIATAEPERGQPEPSDRGSVTAPGARRAASSGGGHGRSPGLGGGRSSAVGPPGRVRRGGADPLAGDHAEPDDVDRAERARHTGAARGRSRPGPARRVMAGRGPRRGPRRRASARHPAPGTAGVATSSQTIGGRVSTASSSAVSLATWRAAPPAAPARPTGWREPLCSAPTGPTASCWITTVRWSHASSPVTCPPRARTFPRTSPRLRLSMSCCALACGAPQRPSRLGWYPPIGPGSSAGRCPRTAPELPRRGHRSPS